MKHRLFIFLLTVFAAVSVSAQMSKTVQWRLTVKMTKASEGIATLKGSIEPGWHMYDTKAVKSGPQPTVIDFNESTGVKLNGKAVPSPAPVHGYDKLFEKSLSWWEGQVVFRQKFKVTDYGKATIKCTVRYTTCNNERCSMPVTETLSKPVKK